jgi:TonB family protein
VSALLAVSLHVAGVFAIAWHSSHVNTTFAGARRSHVDAGDRESPQQEVFKLSLITMETPALVSEVQSSQPLAPQSARVASSAHHDQPTSPPKSPPANGPTRSGADDVVSDQKGVEAASPQESEVISVQGEPFPDSAYLRHIVKVITAEWDGLGRDSSRAAVVHFTISRDGSVTDIAIEQSSKDYLFDVEAAGAVEAVRTGRRIGPLPASWKADRLSVRFRFTFRKEGSP